MRAQPYSLRDFSNHGNAALAEHAESDFIGHLKGIMLPGQKHEPAASRRYQGKWHG